MVYFPFAAELNVLTDITDTLRNSKSHLDHYDLHPDEGNALVYYDAQFDFIIIQ